MKIRITMTILAVLMTAVGALAEDPYPVEWIRQLGTAEIDETFSVAVDAASNAFVSGYTYGDLGGPNAGVCDAFLAKVDSAGTPLWTKQLGTSVADRSHSVAADDAGNAFITGETYGVLGSASAGSADAFVTKYDLSGGPVWTQQFGTLTLDIGRSVTVDGGGNILVGGWTDGSLGGPHAGGEDAFVAKVDSSGGLLWTRQLGTASRDAANSVAIDSAGNAWVCGRTSGDLGGPSAGERDAFLAKVDTDGNVLWTGQLGTISTEAGDSVALDAADNVFISGYTYGALGGPNAGRCDAFLAKYDAAGKLLWTDQLGTSELDYGWAVAADVVGNLFLSGCTDGSLGGPNAGGTDVFLTRHNVPEPVTMSLLALGALALLRRRE